MGAPATTVAVINAPMNAPISSRVSPATRRYVNRNKFRALSEMMEATGGASRYPVAPSVVARYFAARYRLSRISRVVNATSTHTNESLS